MAYNPQLYFPQNYTPAPMYQPVQQPMPQGRMVDIIPVDSIDAAEAFPVPVGSTVVPTPLVNVQNSNLVVDRIA